MNSLNCYIILNMSIILKDKAIKSAKSSDSLKIAYAYAALLVIFAVCQLFTFDDFLKLLVSFSLPGGDLIAWSLGCVVVVCEVFALPFLLRIRLRYQMRIISMVLGWIVPVLWLCLTAWLNSTTNSIYNIGFLGTTFDIMPGLWAVYASVAMGIMAIWASWGLWPDKE